MKIETMKEDLLKGLVLMMTNLLEGEKCQPQYFALVTNFLNFQK